MNVRPSSAREFRVRRGMAAFTLPEALIATSVFTLLVLGIISANLFGLRWYQLGQDKLVATDSAREAIGKLSDELRMCNNAVVGNVTNGLFLAHVNGEQLQGNGLMIYATTNTNSYILYFLNSTNHNFIRYTTDYGTNLTIATSVTNTNIFQIQDCLGNVLTNGQNNHVIRCTLQFYNLPHQSPTPICFQIQTAVAPRSQN